MKFETDTTRSNPLSFGDVDRPKPVPDVVTKQLTLPRWQLLKRGVHVCFVPMRFGRFRPDC
jgi:hypothetical protein